MILLPACGDLGIRKCNEIRNTIESYVYIMATWTVHNLIWFSGS